SFTKSNASLPSLTTEEVVFLGYGIDDPAYSDYDGVDVDGKVILIYQGEPMTLDSVSHISGSKELSEWATDWRKKLRAAKSKGVTTVLFIERNVKFWTTRYAYRLTNPTLMIAHKDQSQEFANSLYISPDVAKNIIGKRYEKVLETRDNINATGQPAHVELKCKIEIRQAEQRLDVSGENVLGFIEGSDPDLKNELLVVSAHYDHLGKRGGDIFNGADDNASGTSALMELAQAFAEAKKQAQGPKRSVLLMAVSGEEKGLLGSEHYVYDPRFPLEQTVANINIDMIGRVDRHHQDNPQYIYVIGADRLSTQLHDIIVEQNETYTNLFLDYTYNEEDDPNRYYYRSDHYNFAERGIPAAFFFSGTHKDYHRKTDTAEKLDYDRMQSIARLAFHTVWELANRPDRIVVDK
ncbi:MAG: M28 family peptidase, partial [Bacteroidota bacterium]